MYPVPDSGISSISFDEDKPKKHRPPKNLAHAGGGAIKKHKAELKSLECSIKVTVATIIFVASLTITAIALMIAFRPTETYRQKICRQIQEAEVKPSIWDINFCLEGDCEFDVGACTNSCPFGYESDEKTNCAVSCQCAVKGTFEADIRFDSENLPRLIKYYFDPNGGNNFALQSSSTVNWRWPKNENGKVIVAVYPHPESGMHRVGNVIRAGDWFAKHTCIHLQVSSAKIDPSITVLVGGGGCFSRGIGFGTTSVALGVGCAADDIVIHEFMHALGFYHEQSRPDREAYIDIFPDHIIRGREGQFEKAPTHALKDLNSPYDLASIMHYGSMLFSNGKGPTILAKDGKFIERSVVPTQIDIAELNAYYECGDNVGWVKGNKWSPWTEYSSCYGYCGKGFKTRYRTCTDAAGNYAYGCGETAVAGRPCYFKRPCRGVPTAWGPWTPCVKTCGSHIQRKYRSRRCDPEAKECGLDYKFWDVNQIQDCTVGIDCEEKKEKVAKWFEWSSWTNCGEYCSVNETSNRYRYCLDELHQASLDCEPGTLKNTFLALHRYQQVQLRPCTCKFVVKGEIPFVPWSHWKQWSKCSATCEGTRSRSRECKKKDDKEKCTLDPDKVTLKLDTETESCGRRSCGQQPTDILSPEWTSPLLFCLYGQVYPGYFNDDKQSDFLCLYPDGFIRLYFATEDGHFDKVSWEGPSLIGISYEIYEYVYIGDINGDGLDDLFSHNSYDLHMTAMFNKGGWFSMPFDLEVPRDLVVYYPLPPEERLQRCGQNAAIVKLIDVNGDKKDDFVCGDHRQALLGIKMNVYKGPQK